MRLVLVLLTGVFLVPSIAGALSLPDTSGDCAKFALMDFIATAGPGISYCRDAPPVTHLDAIGAFYDGPMGLTGLVAVIDGPGGLHAEIAMRPLTKLDGTPGGYLADPVSLGQGSGLVSGVLLHDGNVVGRSSVSQVA